MRRFWCAAAWAALAMLAACSPQYNWRQVTVGEQVQAMFPDKPETRTRSLDYADRQVDFTLTSTEVDGVVFAIGRAPWPEGLSETGRAQMYGQMVESLYRNLGADLPAALPQAGESFEVRGQARDATPMIARARMWATPVALVQGVVMGPEASYAHAQAQEFLQAIVTGP